MKKAYRYLFGIALVSSLAGCDDYLVTEPQTIVQDEQIWSDAALVTNVLADLYDRVPQHLGLENFQQWQDFASFDEALYSGVTAGAQFRNSITTYGFNSFTNFTNNGNDWVDSYELIRDINLAMDNVTAGSMTDAQKTRFNTELRFLRALTYFELVKRYGGVPLITEQQTYDFSGDPSSLQHPRASEAAVYDFIGSEVDAIANQLGNAGSQTRANRYAALALKSRAMLYAGSIARHNNGVVPDLPGGAVGIPESRAAEYYTKSLEASRAIIQSRAYSLARGPDEGQAFHNVFVTKGNSEVILAKDYLKAQGKGHFFTMQVYPGSVPHAVNANWGGAAISPTLNLVENFDYVDGSSGEMRGVGDGTVGGQANWTFYQEMDDIFEGKDGRMFGTVMHPGGTFAGQPLKFQAGVYVWNGSRYERETGSFGSTYSDGGVLTGRDGPLPATDYASNTGFLVKKYADPDPGAALITGSETWWVLFRLGEIYMNATEAAYELGETGEALGYINELRERAGFPANSLTSLTLEKIQDERWSELSFEDHRLWDLKRWRLAHVLWDGSQSSTTANVLALYPYRIVHPGSPRHNTFVYDRISAPAQGAARFFRLGNYYSEIPDDAINANPNIVRNPFH